MSFLKNVFHVLRHWATRCPQCGLIAYCEQCAFCKVCRFAAPEVLPQPSPPLPRIPCRECKETTTHAIHCSVTQKLLAN